MNSDCLIFYDIDWKYSFFFVGFASNLKQFQFNCWFDSNFSEIWSEHFWKKYCKN